MNKIGQYEILNSKAVKNILFDLNEQFGFSKKLDYAFLKSKKDKILIINKDVDLIEHEKLHVDALGLYFGKYYNDGFRLSIEGAQLIGDFCLKNVVLLSKEQKHEWLKGNDISVNVFEGFIILKSGADYLGCAKVKNGLALNSVPKARTLKNVNEDLH